MSACFIHSSLWRDGTHLLWDQGLGSLSWFFHDQVLNESGLLIGKPGELAANDCKKMSKDTLEGSGPVCHRWQQSYQFLLDFLRTHSSKSKENSFKCIQMRHVSLARFLSMYCATFEEQNTKYSKQLLMILNVYTSIAARGGGGSFKREKYIMQKNMWL